MSQTNQPDDSNIPRVETLEEPLPAGGETPDTPDGPDLVKDLPDSTNAAADEVGDARSAGVEGDTGEDKLEATEETPQTAPTGDDLKVVLSLREGLATIGVQQPNADVFFENFPGLGILDLTDEIPAVIARARAHWDESPKNPAFQRPAAPRKSQRKKGQTASQDKPAAPDKAPPPGTEAAPENPAPVKEPEGMQGALVLF